MLPLTLGAALVAEAAIIARRAAAAWRRSIAAIRPRTEASLAAVPSRLRSCSCSRLSSAVRIASARLRSSSASRESLL